MTKRHAENVRLKREYFAYLKEAKRNSEHTVDAAAQAVARFESYTRKSFRAFHIRQAISFKAHLAKQTNPRTGRPLSKATIAAMLAALKAFFIWLAGQRGFKSRVTYSDAEYFNVSARDGAIAKATNERRAPSIEQIRRVLSLMPRDSDIDRRNRALVAFTILTGARDNAIASIRLKHVDLAERRLYQDAREVRTKFAKSFPTFFFEVGNDIEAIVVEWIGFLVSERHWGPDDPLFPKTLVRPDAERRFAVLGLSRECWSNAASIRTIFRQAFETAGLPYANPHSFRNTLAKLAQQSCRTAEEFKAWSQNLGHEKVLTTFMSYGAVSTNRQAELIRNAGRLADSQENIAVLLRGLVDRHERSARRNSG